MIVEGLSIVALLLATGGACGMAGYSVMEKRAKALELERNKLKEVATTLRKEMQWAKEACEALEQQSRELEKDYINLQTKHRMMVFNNSMKGTNNSIMESDTVKEMIKFAMTQAHPDKANGSHDKFIKYREVYNEVFNK